MNTEKGTSHSESRRADLGEKCITLSRESNRKLTVTSYFQRPQTDPRLAAESGTQ